jgi:trehalose 6-phosphate synthase
VRVLVAANRAPIRQTDDGTWTAALGGLATALLPVLEQSGGVWVAMREPDEDAPLTQPYPEKNPAFEVRRIPLSEGELARYYGGMSNSVLWPICHYMLHHMDVRREDLDTYRSVNARFAEGVLDAYQEGDLVWIQDYHLMLVPELLRREAPEATIGHFWHIPWPAMEVFRIIPQARDLLRGLLGCDLIGFHVQEYVDNFLKACRVLLGAHVEPGTVYWEGRRVRVEAHPIGVDTERFEQMSESDEAIETATQLRALAATPFFIVGIDRLDYTKGVLSRMMAFERFLERYPEHHGEVSLLQVATPSRTDVASYQQLKREVDEAVGRINGAYSDGRWTPIHYRYRSYTQDEIAAFYRAADAALITPLRDGMNLVTQEFIVASRGGALILSELTGAAYLLPEAVQVNPYDQECLVESIHEVLTMPEGERLARYEAMRAQVKQLDVHVWARRYLEALASASRSADRPPDAPRSVPEPSEGPQESTLHD